jgi:hypothetical protein
MDSTTRSASWTTRMALIQLLVRWPMGLYLDVRPVGTMRALSHLSAHRTHVDLDGAALEWNAPVCAGMRNSRQVLE